MCKENELAERAAYLLDYVDLALEKIKSLPENDAPEYKSFMHGQVYGIGMALRILFPGEDNWGEKAALKIRPVLTEHKCECED